MDWKVFGVWRHHEFGYLTSTRTGRQPVFLHEVGNPIPCMLKFTDREQMQHPKLEWYSIRLLDTYEPGWRSGLPNGSETYGREEQHVNT